MSAGERDPWYAYPDRTPKTYTQEDLDAAVAAERVLRVRKEQQIETLLRGITDARCLMDPIWRERMGAESVREYVQRGLRCIYSAVTDCQFTGPNTELKDDTKKSGEACTTDKS